MDNKILLPISILILACSIIFGSIWIGHSIEKTAEVQKFNVESKEKALLTAKESADYLNISLEDFQGILASDDVEKKEMLNSGISNYPTYKYMPYIELSGKRLFGKKELDEWIKYNMFNY